MKDNKILISKWEQILQKLENNNGNFHQIEIGKKATIQEIEAKEKELGYQLPPSYKYILHTLGKSLSFYYSFSEDTMIPSEFKEIFSGEINWNIDFLQNLNMLANELMEDGGDYGRSLRGKLEFSHAGNGDIYAFDMSVESDEKPVIYWDHEEDTVTYVADSFFDYLFRITELGCIGSEKWQLEYFLSDTGLNTKSPAAVKWKNWFESFSETTLNDVKNNRNS
ncbi:SMI1/KNR4 family protein [Neobacillus sp. NRS-1170]|uniref:SMI1/KNR4 family protein n=1 Tax=Neobacillus sp. NRS-1170 TaxID=3233898 RepID=UPI003D2BC04A